MKFKDKVALVTGSGQGIGEGLALRFAQEGCSVAAVDINEESAGRTAKKIEEAGGAALPVRVDVTKSSEVNEMVKGVIDRFGKIDICINCAGILKAHFIADFPEETWRQIIDINLTGYFLVVKAVSAEMVKRKSGKIINISSKSGKVGSLWNSAYSASKFGIIGLSQSAALDLAPFNINVNVICPGNVLSSPLWAKLDKEYSKKLGITPEEVRRKYVEKVPLGRDCRIEDIANVAVFLASEEASYMTGQSINVTGGQEMR